MGLVPEEPGPPEEIAGQRELLSRLRAVVEAKDAENAALRRELDAERELRRRLELRLAELERRLSMDSSDSGTPSSKERIGAKEARRARQQSERVRRGDRKRGGQPGHRGTGLARDPDPDENKDADPPAQCRRCGAGLGGAAAAGSRWAQVIDVEVIRKATEWALPGLECRCCGTVTFAEPPPGAHAGSVSYGAVLNAAAVVLTGYGNVPPERAAQVMAMLLGVPVSAGWVDKASARLAAQLGQAGFDAAMLAALAGEKALAADETPVTVLDRAAPQPAAREEEDKDPDEKDGTAPAGAPHVLIVRTPDGRLTWLQALASRRKAAVAAGIPAAFTGLLMTDGYTGYQHLLSRLAGIQQCCQHIIRRRRAVTKLGPGGLQSWAGDIIAILREAHQAVARRPRPRQHRPGRGSRWTSSASATTTPPPSGSPTTGCGTGTRETTPATRWAAGCATTRNRSSCSPATSPWTGRPTSPSAAPKPPSATRPSPATGTPSPPSPAGAASEATSTPPPPTASPHSTPSATHSPGNPGYRHCPPSADTNSRHPVNGHA